TQVSSSSDQRQCVDKGMVCAKFPAMKNVCVRPSPCFAELMHYEVRAGREFVFGGYQRQFVDPQTGECKADPAKSELFTNRIPIGLPVYPVVLGPQCISPFEVLGTPDPNPCFERIETGYAGLIEKGESSSEIHVEEGPVTVVWYSNPDVWFGLGTSHLSALSIGSSNGGEKGQWVPMPARGLTYKLGLNSGYSNLVAAFPSNISLPAMMAQGTDKKVYVVDMGDLVTNMGTTRGQILRFHRSTLALDSSFLVK
ncbi:MAG: hypothetical protein V1754_07660, partial [Pseudomonadota bacterium]